MCDELFFTDVSVGCMVHMSAVASIALPSNNSEQEKKCSILGYYGLSRA